jgi:molybdate transport system permease protein
MIDLPMILPPAVAGLALLMAFGRRGLLGSEIDRAGLEISFTSTAVVIAQIFVASPFYIRAASAAFANIPRLQEEAASDLGAGPFTVFRTITLRLAAPGLSAGAVLCWARAVGEFGATIMFAGNLPRRTQTLPLAIYGRYEAGELTTSLVMALILLVCSFLVLASVRGFGARVRLPASR